jgi:hypothetical protein
LFCPLLFSILGYRAKVPDELLVDGHSWGNGDVKEAKPSTIEAVDEDLPEMIDNAVITRETRGEDEDVGLSSDITAGRGARVEGEGRARSGSEARWGQV